MGVCPHSHSHTHTLARSLFSGNCRWTLSSIGVDFVSCLQPGTIVHSDSSRTILHPQLFPEPRINSRLLAVNQVNGLYSPKVMTRRYAVMLGNIFHLSRKLKRKHGNFLPVRLVQLDLYTRYASMLLDNTDLSKIYRCDCGIWMNTHKQMKRRMREVLAVICIVETDLADILMNIKLREIWHYCIGFNTSTGKCSAP